MCLGNSGGMEQEGNQDTDPVKEGSKEDAHNSSCWSDPSAAFTSMLCTHLHLPGVSSIFRP